MPGAFRLSAPARTSLSPPALASAVFILSCGTTHLMDVVLFYNPLYHLSGLVKLITAAASWGTVISLFFVIPQALAMRSPASLEAELQAKQEAEVHRQRTEQERIARAQAEATARLYQTVAEAMPQIVWTARPDGWLDYYNQRWFDYTGLNLEQTQGWGWEPVIHPDDLQNCVNRWTEAVRTGTNYEVEYRFKRASDGLYRWYLGRAHPVRDQQGEIIKWIGTCTGIEDQEQAAELLLRSHRGLEQHVVARTSELNSANEELRKEIDERRRTEAELIAVSQELAATIKASDPIMEYSLDVICPIDEEGKFIQLSPACEKMWGYKPQELIGRRYMELVHPEDWEKTIQIAQSIMAGDPVRDFENRYTRKDASVVSVMWSAHWSQTEKIMFCVARDVTERKQAEQRQQQILKELSRSNAELEQFAYIASHDLQEPLRAISGCVQVLQRRYGEQLDSRAHELINHAVDGSARLQTLIHDLLAFSRVGTRGKVFEPTDCNQIMADVIRALRTSIDESHATVTYDDLPTVVADSVQLSQVFQNLVGNAIKYRDERTLQVHISAQRQDAEWVFSVRDNGIGIEEQYFERVFTMFQRLHTRTEYSGTGIGLAITRKIVERHRGRIWSESVPEQGSTFFFTLAAKQA
jgi:PAS domain S-box-containing protein